MSIDHEITRRPYGDTDYIFFYRDGMGDRHLLQFIMQRLINHIDIIGM